MTKERISILISGSGTNMEAIIKNTQNGILKDLCEISLVIADKKDAGGLIKAKSLGVPVVCVESKNKKREAFEQELIKCLNPYQPDFIILAGFMRILTPLFINQYRRRIINIHPADTTAYQGAKGYDWAFQQGLTETWVTVHYVDEGVDTGCVIAKRRVDLAGSSSVEDVKRRGLSVENSFYSEALYSLLLNQKARSSPCVVS